MKKNQEKLFFVNFFIFTCGTGTLMCFSTIWVLTTGYGYKLKEIQLNLIEKYWVVEIQINGRLISKTIFEIAENYQIQRLFYVIYCIFVIQPKIREKTNNVVRTCGTWTGYGCGICFSTVWTTGYGWKKMKLKEKLQIAEFFVTRTCSAYLIGIFSIFPSIHAEFSKKLLSKLNFCQALPVVRQHVLQLGMAL